MITITVTSTAEKESAEKVMWHGIMWEPRLNGAEYVIEFGDYRSIDGVEDASVAGRLMSSIFSREIEA